MNKVVRTICQMCDAGCAMDVHVKNNKIIKVEGARDYPTSLGGLCSKGLSAVQFEYDPKRLLQPLKRKGERGQGKWEKISLNEALNIISRKLKEIKKTEGPQALCYYRGAAPGWGTNYQYVRRFMNLFGSPNLASHSHICSVPRWLAKASVYGIRPVSDFENTKLIILWGFNPAETKPFSAKRILDAKERGAKLVVIDPRFSPMASKADIFIQPRPGTDGALALSMLHTIIKEGLYDKEFVRNWTIGFEQLSKMVEDYPPEEVEKITWVPSGTIVQVARLYATNRPACIDDGNGLDQHTNVVQTVRCLAMLHAITGNLGIVGGELFSPELLFGDILLQDKLPKEPGPIGKHPLFYNVWGLGWPEVQDTLFSGKPYPIKAMIVQGGCPVVINSNSDKTREALKKLEFLVVHDIFMTRTTELADIVLPAATFLERTLLYKFRYIWKPDSYTNVIGLQNKVLEPPGECLSDQDFIFLLARKMNFGEYFPWKNIIESIDEELKPLKITYEELRKSLTGISVRIKEEDLIRNYEKVGFQTPSKKVELYSETYKKFGYDPLPNYVEPGESPISRPDLGKDYPLICNTGKKPAVWTHTQYRNLSLLNRIDPDPIVEIHPDKAKELDINHGDEVIVESLRGNIRLKAYLTEVTDPRVVFITHGWGQPYAKGPIINRLTDSSERCPISSATGNRSFLCRVRKVAKEDL